jgi:hypothetical protein
VQGIYDSNGVRFRFPEHWELHEERSENQLSITVSSPDTSFWTLSLFFKPLQEDELMETALDAFREEYQELDIYPVVETICHRESIARDLEFVCIELINSAFLRVFQTSHFTALILYQGTDQELEMTREQLENISLSLRCEGGESDFGE